MGGPILAPNEVMVPAQGSRFVRLNKWGNMTQGQYTQILSQLRNESSAGGGKTRNIGRVGRYYFLNSEQTYERNMRNKKAGVFLRKGKGKRASTSRVMSVIRTPVNTAPRFQFYKWTEENIKEVFAQEVSRQLRRI